MGNTNADKALGLAAGDEVREWQDALSAVIQHAGPERAHALLEELLEHARQHSIDMPFSATTGYVNTIEPEEEERSPGNLELEGRLRAYMRWNAMAMVVKANRLKPDDGGDLGGHISSFASLAHMLAAGFNHFWHADDTDSGGTHGGDATDASCGAPGEPSDGQPRSSRLRMSSSVSAPDRAPSASMTSAKRSALRALSSMTFSSMVSAAT